MEWVVFKFNSVWILQKTTTGIPFQQTCLKVIVLFNEKYFTCLHSMENFLMGWVKKYIKHGKQSNDYLTYLNIYQVAFFPVFGTISFGWGSTYNCNRRKLIYEWAKFPMEMLHDVSCFPSTSVQNSQACRACASVTRQSLTRKRWKFWRHC